MSSVYHANTVEAPLREMIRIQAVNDAGRAADEEAANARHPRVRHTFNWSYESHSAAASSASDMEESAAGTPYNWDSDTVTHSSDIYSYVPAHRPLLVPPQSPPTAAVILAEAKQVSIPSVLELGESFGPLAGPATENEVDGNEVADDFNWDPLASDLRRMRFSQRAVSVASSASDIEDMIINDDALEFDRYNNWSTHASNSSDFSNLTRWDLDTPDLLVPYVNYLQLRRTRSFAPPFDLESYIIRRELRRTPSAASSPDMVPYASRLELRAPAPLLPGPCLLPPLGLSLARTPLRLEPPLPARLLPRRLLLPIPLFALPLSPSLTTATRTPTSRALRRPPVLPVSPVSGATPGLGRCHMAIAHTADLGDLAEVDPGMPSPFTPRRPPLVRSQRYSPFERNWGPGGSVNDPARPWL